MAIAAGAPLAWSHVFAPAEIAPLASRSRLLDAAAAREVVLAVGERGHILRSADGGRTWEQMPAPVRSTLTCVSFLDPHLCLAAGHDGVVLRSLDAGQSWSTVFAAPEEGRPWLTLQALTGVTAVVGGAYGWLARTVDGGASFETGLAHPDEPHVNALSHLGNGQLLAACEFGMLLHSTDGGASFQALESPYAGSLFGAATTVDGTLLVHGLRGNLLVSKAQQERWTHVPLETEATLFASTITKTGLVVIGGASGIFVTSEDNGSTFRLHRDPKAHEIASVTELPEGSVLVTTEDGLLKSPDPTRPEQLLPIGSMSRD